jgi:hypothetical protein
MNYILISKDKIVEIKTEGSDLDDEKFLNVVYKKNICLLVLIIRFCIIRLVIKVAVIINAAFLIERELRNKFQGIYLR